MQMSLHRYHWNMENYVKMWLCDKLSHNTHRMGEKFQWGLSGSPLEPPLLMGRKQNIFWSGVLLFSIRWDRSENFFYGQQLQGKGRSEGRLESQWLAWGMNYDLGTVDKIQIYTSQHHRQQTLTLCGCSGVARLLILNISPIHYILGWRTIYISTVKR